MATDKKLIYGLDPSKYPSRMGQPWKEDEIVKLLTSIQNKKPIEEIAKEHDRTVGGIESYIRKLAVDYSIRKLPMEEIQKYTGLTKEQIEEAIKKHENKSAAKKSSESVKIKIVKKVKAEEEDKPTMTEIVYLLKDIQSKLNSLLEKVA